MWKKWCSCLGLTSSAMLSERGQCDSQDCSHCTSLLAPKMPVLCRWAMLQQLCASWLWSCKIWLRLSSTVPSTAHSTTAARTVTCSCWSCCCRQGRGVSPCLLRPATCWLPQVHLSHHAMACNVHGRFCPTCLVETLLMQPDCTGKSCHRHDLSALLVCTDRDQRWKVICSWPFLHDLVYDCFIDYTACMSHELQLGHHHVSV